MFIHETKRGITDVQAVDVPVASKTSTETLVSTDGDGSSPQSLDTNRRGVYNQHDLYIYVELLSLLPRLTYRSPTFVSEQTARPLFVEDLLVTIAQVIFFMLRRQNVKKNQEIIFVLRRAFSDAPFLAEECSDLWDLVRRTCATKDPGRKQRKLYISPILRH